MRQFLALLFTIPFLLSSSGCGAGQVLGPTVAPTLTSTATPTLTPTATQTSTATPIPTPAVEAGLHGDNAAQTVYENSTWIVRNANGEVTATWDEATGLWTYDMDVVKTNQLVAGIVLAEMSKYYPSNFFTDVLSRLLPPDEPSTHFIDPVTNKPMRYGTFKEASISVNHSTLGPYEQDVTYVSVRVRGSVSDEYGNPDLILSVPTGVDSESIVIIPLLPSRLPLMVFGISNKDITGNLEEIERRYIKSVPEESVEDFLNGQAFGQQVLIMVKRNLPIGYLGADDEERIKRHNIGAEETIAFFNGDPHKPAIEWSNFIQHIIMYMLIFPQEESGPLVIEQP